MVLGHEAPLHCHVCNGKPKLSSVRSEIHGLNFDRARYVFFVDRDYDDFLGTQIVIDDRTYLTDRYSIESDVATEEALKILLVDFGGMSKADAAYTRIVEGYRKGFILFAQRIISISAWIISMRAQGRKVNLNNVNLGNVFEITSTIGIRKKRGGFNCFRKEVGLPDADVPFAELVHWIKTLRSIEPKRWIRGKYDLWFFRSYLLALISKHHSRSCKWKIPGPLREDRMFEALGGRVPSPKSLEKFLANTCPT